MTNFPSTMAHRHLDFGNTVSVIPCLVRKRLISTFSFAFINSKWESGFHTLFGLRSCGKASTTASRHAKNSTLLRYSKYLTAENLQAPLWHFSILNPNRSR